MTVSNFLDSETLAAELGVGLTTLRRWRRVGEGPPFVRCGRLIRYRREDVNAWIAAQTVGVAS